MEWHAAADRNTDQPPKEEWLSALCHLYPPKYYFVASAAMLIKRPGQHGLAIRASLEGAAGAKEEAQQQPSAL